MVSLYIAAMVSLYMQLLAAEHHVAGQRPVASGKPALHVRPATVGDHANSRRLGLQQLHLIDLM
jgi:hypothetical protein